MNKTAKTIIILAVILFVGFLIFNLFSKPRQKDIASSSFYEQQVQSYNDYMKKQTEQSNAYMKNASEQLDRVIKLNDKSMENQLRFEKILDRWEKQADRYDEFLNKLDKKNTTPK